MTPAQPSASPSPEFDGAIVVGSSASGVACAMALVARGIRVRLLDGGRDLPPDRQEIQQRMARTPKRDWTAADMAALRGDLRPSRHGVSKKLLFGSDHAYADGDPLLPVSMAGADFSASLAAGGFTVVWGAGVLGFTDEELAAWPVSREALLHHESEVANWMPVGGVADGLASSFPLPSRLETPLVPSAQGRRILENLDKRKTELAARGITGGAARLAVFNRPGRECVYCGQCLRGCPLDLIFSGKHALRQLAESPLFEHHPGLVVDRIRETDGTVHVDYRRREGDGRTVYTMTGRRAFVGAGPLVTSRILMESLGWHGRPVTLRDSLYFLQPAMMWRGQRGVISEELHTLAQAFVEIQNAAVCSQRVHLSVYTYNDLFPEAIRGMFGPAGSAMIALLRPMLSRLILAGGYLHSNLSPSMTLTLERGEPRLLRIRADSKAAAMPVIRRVSRFMARASRLTGFIPVEPMLSVQGPGRGFHFGCSFPMSANPVEGQCDVLGRPCGFNRVHAIDASVFPDIPSGPVTSVVMANAHRIGTAAPAD